MTDLQVVYALAGTIIIPSVIGIVRYKGLSMPLKFITLLLTLGLINEALMIALSALKVNNLFTIHFYALVEIIFLSLYFHRQIESQHLRKVVIVITIALSAFSIIYAFTGNNIAQFNSIPRAIECVYFSILSCVLFYEMSDISRKVDESDYYVNGAILIYFTSCFIIFAFSKYIASNQGHITTMFWAHSYVNAFCNLAYAIGLWIASKRYYIQP
jgi:hypothetical protein